MRADLTPPAGCFPTGGVGADIGPAGFPFGAALTFAFVGTAPAMAVLEPNAFFMCRHPKGSEGGRDLEGSYPLRRELSTGIGSTLVIGTALPICNSCRGEYHSSPASVSQAVQLCGLSERAGQKPRRSLCRPTPEGGMQISYCATPSSHNLVAPSTGNFRYLRMLIYFVSMLLCCEIWIPAAAGTERGNSENVSKVPRPPGTPPTNNPHTPRNEATTLLHNYVTQHTL